MTTSARDSYENTEKGNTSCCAAICTVAGIVELYRKSTALNLEYGER